MYTKSIFLAFSLCAIACFGDWDGWHPVAWSRPRWYTNDTPATVNVWVAHATQSYTNYSGTNRYIGTNFYEYGYTFENIGNVTGRFTVTSFSNSAALAWTVTNISTQTLQAIELQPREVIAYDGYRATRERMRAIRDEADVVAVMRTYPPVFRDNGYGSLRESLVWCKQWIGAYCTNFANVNVIGTNTTFEEYFRTNFVDSNFPIYGNLNDIMASSLPSNYLTYTPNRYLRCGETGFSYVSTCIVWHVESATNQTNNVAISVTDCCGYERTVTNKWTNGAFATIVCTNEVPFDEGGTNWLDDRSDSWGWCAITNIYRKMIYTPKSPCESGAGSYVKAEVAFADSVDLTNACRNFPDAIALLAYAWANEASAGCRTTNDNQIVWTNLYECSLLTEQANNSFPPRGKWYSKFFYTNYPPVFAYTAEYFFAYSGNMAGSMGVKVGSAATGMSYRADLYASCRTNYSDQVSAPIVSPWWTNVVFQYDDYGLGFTTNKTVWYSVVRTGPSTNLVSFGDSYDPTGATPDDRLDLPSESSTPSNNEEATVRGYFDPHFLWVLDWSVTNGFRYK